MEKYAKFLDDDEKIESFKPMLEEDLAQLINFKK